MKKLLITVVSIILLFNSVALISSGLGSNNIVPVSIMDKFSNNEIGHFKAVEEENRDIVLKEKANQIPITVTFMQALNMECLCDFILKYNIDWKYVQGRLLTKNNERLTFIASNQLQLNEIERLSIDNGEAIQADFVGYISLNGYVSSGLLLEIQNNTNVFLVEPVISDSKKQQSASNIESSFPKDYAWELEEAQMEMKNK